MGSFLKGSFEGKSWKRKISINFAGNKLPGMPLGEKSLLEGKFLFSNYS